MASAFSIIDLNVIKTNRYMEHLYAHRKSLVGQKCYHVYQGRSSPCPWCPTLRALDTGRASSALVPHPSSDDPTGWIELSAFPVKDKNGDIVANQRWLSKFRFVHPGDMEMGPEGEIYLLEYGSAWYDGNDGALKRHGIGIAVGLQQCSLNEHE